MSETYRRLSGYSQATNIKTDGLTKKNVFLEAIVLYYISIPVFYRKKKYSKVLNGDVHGRLPFSGCLEDQRRSRDVRSTSVKYIFKIKLTNTLNLLTGYSVLYS